MLSFSNYLLEARVSKDNLDKVADIFLRIFEKNLSTKLYRFAGPRGFTEIENGIGILYFYDRKKALRLNYIKGEIKSITMWNDFKLGKSGDFTIDLGGLGLLQAGKKLISIIKNIRIGSIKTYPEYLDESLLTEAKRISPADFFELVQTNLQPGLSIDSLSWSTIADIAISNDYQIPVVVRNTRVAGTKGATAKYDLRKLVTDTPNSDEISKKSEPDYYIKITAQDRETKKFLSVKGDKRAESLLQKISKEVLEPDYKKEVKDPDSLFGIMKNLVQVVCRRNRNALIIYGGPGIGKTWVVTDTIKSEGLAKNKDWFTIKGKITTSALYQTLFMHRKGSLLVFDDTDSIWGDQEAANILKAALDSYDERVISWVSPRTVNVSKMTDSQKEEYNDTIDKKMEENPDDPKIRLPSEFIFNGRIIFISNLAYDKFDTAVLNRSAKIDMTLTQEQVFKRMKNILEHLGDKSVPINIKEEILEFLMSQSNKGIMDSVSMRTYVAAEDFYKSGLPNWRELVGHA